MGGRRIHHVMPPGVAGLPLRTAARYEPGMSADRPTFEEMRRRLSDVTGVPFGELLPRETLEGMRLNKGGAGAAVEALLGVKAGTRLTDFVDGELKTYRADRDGLPKESVAVLQLGPDIDRYMELPQFVETPLYRKIRRTALLGVYRDTVDPAEWQVVFTTELNATPGAYWHEQLERSYIDLLRQLLNWLHFGGDFHTINAEHLQIRVRDSRPYTPLFSARLGRRLCDKKLGFYFRRDFVRGLVEENLAGGERSQM